MTRPAFKTAEQRIQISEARQKLEEELIAFLHEMNEGSESALGRNPRSRDLLPFFQRYAWAVIAASHKVEIMAAPSLAEAKIRLQSAIDGVYKTICRKPDPVQRRPAGTWLCAVRRACDAVAFGVNRTTFGQYDRTVFMNPPGTQLKARLQVQGRQLIREYLEMTAKQKASGVNTPPDKKVSGSEERESRFPARATWLRQRLGERNWNNTKFHNNRGPDRKTTNKILRGEAVSESTLDNVVSGLNEYSGARRFTEISLRDIPNK